MANEWYYKLMGEEIGPLSGAELRRHAHAGRLTPDMYVRRGDTDRWVTAGTVRGLFDSPKSDESIQGAGSTPHPGQSQEHIHSKPQSMAPEDPGDKWKCPKYKSEQIQRLSILHNMGKASVNLKTKGVGVGLNTNLDVSGGVGTANSSGTITSGLAAQLAPPTKPQDPGTVGAIAGFILGCCPCCFGIEPSCALFLLPFLMAIVGMMVEISGRSDEHQANVAKNAQARKVWERTFLCMRCGERFEIE